MMSSVTSATIGQTPIFSTPSRSSVVDVTFNRGFDIHGWHVSNDIKTHNVGYITFKLGTMNYRNIEVETEIRWSRRKFDPQALTDFLYSNDFAIPDHSVNVNEAAEASCQSLRFLHVKEKRSTTEKANPLLD